MRRSIFFALLFGLPWSSIWGQTLIPRSEKPSDTSTAIPQSVPAQIPLTVPAGTPLKVALNQEVRVRRVGEPVEGKIVDPVYAFDKLVIPSGTEVIGKISAIDGISKKRRTLAAMNAEFSPTRQVHVEFSELVLADGRHVPLAADVNQGSGAVLEFVPAKTPEPETKKDEARNAISRRIREAKQQMKQEWIAVKKQLQAPDKKHRLERAGVAQLPYHPQYMEAGTSFNLDLREPLNFGTENLTSGALEHIGTPPPSGSAVHAVLVTPLGSATSKQGDPVEAVITQPLVVSDHLLLPEGSRLQGSVLQVRPARKFSRNGQLRIVFHEVVPPGGIAEKMEGSLEGVDAAKGDHLRLDSEGGAEVKTPKTRYLTTGLTVMLATSSLDGHRHDNDGDFRRGGGNDFGAGAANGATGFRLVGTVVGAFAHSRVLTSGLGFYGAATSVYSHFLSRGRDVVYSKDTSMIIGFGAPPAARTGGMTSNEKQAPLGAKNTDLH